MTEESLETARALKREIERVDEVINNLRPYKRETTILKITVEKQLMNYTPTEVRELRLSSDDPLWLAIGSSLIDLKKELQEKFNNLDSNSEEVVKEPIKKTSFWKKVWGRD